MGIPSTIHISALYTREPMKSFPKELKVPLKEIISLDQS